MLVGCVVHEATTAVSAGTKGGGELGSRLPMCKLVGKDLLRAFSFLTRPQGTAPCTARGTREAAP